MPASLDLAAVRAEFPGLAQDMVFFDNAGGSQTLRRVADRITDFLLNTNVQLGASYETSGKAGERVAESRVRAAELVNAARPEEIVMGGSTTALLRTLAQGLAGWFSAGDEVIVTNLDHEANIGAWLTLQERGIQIKVWEVDPETLRLEPEQLERLIGPRTRLVALTHASNIVGTINPIAEIVKTAHAHGVLVAVDAVAYAPHRAIDVRALDVDFYVFSFYKVFGPHYAMLYGKYEHLLRMANLNHYFITPETIPYKLQPGNQNYELGWGCTAIGEYVAELGGGPADRRAGIVAGFDAVAAHEGALAQRLLDYLAGKNRVRIVGERSGDPAKRVATISFVVQDTDSEAVVRPVDKHRIGIRFGDFYAKRLIESLGLARQNGVVRVSMVHYNTPEEVDRLIAALEEAI